MLRALSDPCTHDLPDTTISLIQSYGGLGQLVSDLALLRFVAELTYRIPLSAATARPALSDYGPDTALVEVPPKVVDVLVSLSFAEPLCHLFPSPLRSHLAELLRVVAPDVSVARTHAKKAVSSARALVVGHDVQSAVSDFEGLEAAMFVLETQVDCPLPEWTVELESRIIHSILTVLHNRVSVVVNCDPRKVQVIALQLLSRLVCTAPPPSRRKALGVLLSCLQSETAGLAEDSPEASGSTALPIQQLLCHPVFVRPLVLCCALAADSLVSGPSDRERSQTHEATSDGLTMEEIRKTFESSEIVRDAIALLDSIIAYQLKRVHDGSYDSNSHYYETQLSDWWRFYMPLQLLVWSNPHPFNSLQTVDSLLDLLQVTIIYFHRLNHYIVHL